MSGKVPDPSKTTRSKTTRYDLIVAGAGPSGLTFARALRDRGLRVAVIDRQPRALLADPPLDGRDIALTHRSERTLRDLGIWPHLRPEDHAFIRHAKVVNGRSPYALHFDHGETDKPYLGRIVANNAIRRAAFAAFQEVAGADLFDRRGVAACGSDADSAWAVLDDGRRLRAPLLVAADGRFSETRRRLGIAARMRDFGRSCIVCRVAHDLDHDDTAFECFHYGRTLAVLPLSNRRSSVVITLPSDQAARVQEQDEADFNRDIATRFDRRLGAMRLTGARHLYPLVGVYANRFHGRRAALLGDAAVGMHPVTAHGFNLGLRGAVTLAGEIRGALARGRDIADPSVLRRYHVAHDRVARPLYLGTNLLVGMYTDDRPPARVARSALLHLGNLLHPARRAIMRQLTDTHA